MSRGNKQIWGGIFCIVPFRYFYDENLLGKVRNNLRKSFGLTSEQMRSFSAIEINAMIGTKLTSLIDEELEKHKGGWEVISTKYSEDVIGESFGYAVFKDGKVLENSVHDAYTEGSWGAERFIKYNLLEGALRTYLKNLKGWNVIIFNYAVMAARIEAEGRYSSEPFFQGFHKMVMIQMINNVVNGIATAVGRKGGVYGRLYYGYILNSIHHPEYRGKKIHRSTQ